ncbi:hypothetical protein RvY_14770 [Ramazzottius varieornatus]|uniref:Uncharacterized protein n=1 Tax=Ramazzottius varieornatus TaxID=947166 RepID=A0A1D1VU21_RAMVA|nr:hypothetical protein RvY_14770 [Ramazzottius varieornatus]
MTTQFSPVRDMPDDDNLSDASPDCHHGSPLPAPGFLRSGQPFASRSPIPVPIKRRRNPLSTGSRPARGGRAIRRSRTISPEILPPFPGHGENFSSHLSVSHSRRPSPQPSIAPFHHRGTDHFSHPFATCSRPATALYVNRAFDPEKIALAVENNLLREQYDQLTSRRSKHRIDQDHGDDDYESPSRKKPRVISEPLLRILADRSAFDPFHLLLLASRNLSAAFDYKTTSSKKSSSLTSSSSDISSFLQWLETFQLFCMYRGWFFADLFLPLTAYGHTIRSLQAKAASRAGRPSPEKSFRAARDVICRDNNAGRCSTPCPNNRSHKCSYCWHIHPFSECSQYQDDMKAKNAASA